MKKIISLSVIVILAISFSGVAVAGEHTATNCHYTGFMTDYCYASTGTKNVKVLACRPGNTDCGFTLPPSQE